MPEGGRAGILQPILSLALCSGALQTPFRQRRFWLQVPVTPELPLLKYPSEGVYRSVRPVPWLTEI